MQVTPGLEPVLRAANTFQEPLGPPVPSLGRSERNALFAETAFLLAGAGFPSQDYERHELESKAREFLMNLPQSSGAEAVLSPEEWLEVADLARKTQRYTERLENPIFSPRIRGCGVVDAATADVLAADELVEIKTVTRPFQANDLRQALTYAAMLYASDRRVGHIALLNPRRARAVRLSIGEIAAATRGDSDVELMQELIEWMTGLQISA
jgi:hypothetical protein